ncbi:MptD family putative ECF transporter S component [Bifidobacterium parmae]|uniref:ABC transporter, permease protein n=1 Tax=Bifidobacterium parmae TaxID=361854 RepID=A0A2N5IZ47_9BIFI|nr:MptD family putative ECF transporter S component [Bifidobacterium parmae]PLS27226.1 ABC transporter, permease protein [Bifidobacterium parmae]
MAQDTTPNTAPAAGASAAPRTPGLGVPDLISIGVFAALYFVMVCVATLASTLFTGGFGSIFLPAVAALISGPVYMLAAARTPKFGGITVMGLVIGLFLFVSGHFVLSFVASVVFPLAADLIARAGAYRGKALLLVSYVVFSYGLTGPILPLWFMKDAYVASLEARGKDAAYIDGVFANITMGTFAASMAAILVCAAIGGWFGQRLCAKHFAKAGVV